MSKTDDYLEAAVEKLGPGALQTQQQTLTLALLMAVCDLLGELNDLYSLLDRKFNGS